MKLSKSSKPKRDRDKWSGAKALLWFLFRHGEKIVVAVVVLFALWIAQQGLDYRPLSWQPHTLVELAESIEKNIKNNTRTFADEGLKVFDYATYAEQIKEHILPIPYHCETAWKPVLHPDRRSRGGFEILTADTFTGEAVRRTNSTIKGKTHDLWQRPPSPFATGETQDENQSPEQDESVIWVNLYGTIPLQQQWDIYNQTFDEAVEINRPEYVYYELERAKINPKEESVWSPVRVYQDHPASPDHEFQTDQNFDLLWDRLIPVKQSLNRQQSVSEKGSSDLGKMLLFSDFDVEPAKTYAYRVRLYLENPNYRVQNSFVAEGVDTRSKFVRSDWSLVARVYVPDRTTVRLQSVTPADRLDFPRQQVSLGTVSGTALLDYFDLEQGLSLQPVEKDVRCGMLGNMSKEEANRYIKRTDSTASVNYPDTGLRSDVCILDFSGGKKLQKKASREAQGTPDLLVVGKALLLMPDGTMQVTSTTPEVFR